MTTSTIALTTTAADLVTTASLAAGTTYLVQNVGAKRAVLAELAAAPAENGGGHILAPGAFLQVKPPASGSLYGWTVRGKTTLAVSEAP